MKFNNLPFFNRKRLARKALLAKWTDVQPDRRRLFLPESSTTTSRGKPKRLKIKQWCVCAGELKDQPPRISSARRRWHSRPPPSTGTVWTDTLSLTWFICLWCARGKYYDDNDDGADGKFDDIILQTRSRRFHYILQSEWCLLRTKFSGSISYTVINGLKLNIICIWIKQKVKF